ncbi:MAG: YoaK family protein [Gemmatimonadaceae bacterium]
MALTKYNRSWRAVALTLAAVAGFTDVQAYLAAGGYFVSFMSGNSTRLGVAAADADSGVWKLAGIVLCFVGGVALGSIGDAFGSRHRRTVVLLLTSLLLSLSAVFQRPDFAYTGVLLMALAMGALNAVFVADSEVHVGITYMTGTLVKLGRHLGERLRGGVTKSWLPYAQHWAALVIGGVLGTLAIRQSVPHALWMPAIATAGMAVVVNRLSRNAAALNEESKNQQ